MRLVAATPATINEAAHMLAAGELVAFPTETVYGLGADATNAKAVAQIYAAKNRPSFNPLINHAASAVLLQEEVLFDSRADELAAHFWPGPLTMVLNKKANARGASITHAGLPFMSVRVPHHAVAQQLLKDFAACGSGLVAAPSANKSNALSPTTAQHVAESLGEAVPFILAGGRCTVGLESTIVDLTTSTTRIVRAGGIAVEDISRLIGPCALAAAGEAPIAPGMLARHYAPKLPLRLEALSALPDEAFLQFGPVLNTEPAHTLNLSPTGDLVEAAANLFDYLHQLQTAPVRAIAVMPVPQVGLGVAINDRLRRGAAENS